MRLKTQTPQLHDIVEASITTGGGRERVVRGEVVAFLSTQFVIVSEQDGVTHDIIRYDGDWKKM